MPLALNRELLTWNPLTEIKYENGLNEAEKEVVADIISDE